MRTVELCFKCKKMERISTFTTYILFYSSALKLKAQKKRRFDFEVHWSEFSEFSISAELMAEAAMWKRNEFKLLELELEKREWKAAQFWLNNADVSDTILSNEAHNGKLPSTFGKYILSTEVGKQQHIHKENIYFQIPNNSLLFPHFPVLLFDAMACRENLLVKVGRVGEKIFCMNYPLR